MLAARLARTFMTGRAGQPMYYGKMVSIGVPVKEAAKDKKPSPSSRTRKPEGKTSSETTSTSAPSPGPRSFLTQENRSGKISSRSSPYDGLKEKKKQQPHPRFTQQKATPTKSFHLSPGLVGAEALPDIQSFLQTPADAPRAEEKTRQTYARRDQQDEEEPKRKWSFDKKKNTPNFKKNKDKNKKDSKGAPSKDMKSGKQKANKEEREYVDQSDFLSEMRIPSSNPLMSQFKSINEVFSQQAEANPQDSLIEEEIQAQRQRIQQEKYAAEQGERKRPTKKDKTDRTIPVAGSLSLDQMKRYFNNQMNEEEMNSLPQGPLDKLMTKEDFEKWQSMYLDYTPLDHERDQADRIFQYHHLTEPFAFCSLKADLPSTVWPEFAFAGRSNVGKSSLLNAVAGINKLARVSSTPVCPPSSF